MVRQHLNAVFLCIYFHSSCCIAGFLRKLKLKIPWRNLGAEPAIVNIEGLYLIVTPKPKSDVRNIHLLRHIVEHRLTFPAPLFWRILIHIFPNGDYYLDLIFFYPHIFHLNGRAIFPTSRHIYGHSVCILIVFMHVDYRKGGRRALSGRQTATAQIGRIDWQRQKTRQNGSKRREGQKGEEGKEKEIWVH
jgi:hypothetical protein